MERAVLGKMGLEVSRLGTGLFQIGLLEDEEQAGRVLKMALNAAGNFLDTVECYGEIEEIIDNSVAHRRDEFVPDTKAGHATGDYGGAP